MTEQTDDKPILVVGATGKVGRRVVQILLAKDYSVRALVRDPQKARELFLGTGKSSENNSDGNLTTNGTTTSTKAEDAAALGSSIFLKQEKRLEIIVCDLGGHVIDDIDTDRDDKDTIVQKEKGLATLRRAVKGCQSIISVSGGLRFSKVTDFVFPWRLFQTDVSAWMDHTDIQHDMNHPYYSAYKSQCVLIDLAKEYNIVRFVRLTGGSVALSPLHYFNMIFGAVFSIPIRYHYLLEQYLHQSGLSYVVLRPGRLKDEDRDPKKVHIQIDASGKVPGPSSVPRSDVAALAVAAVTAKKDENRTMMDDNDDDFLLPSNKSYTLAFRAVGETEDDGKDGKKKKKKEQGKKEDGYATVEECLKSIVDQPDVDGTTKTTTAKEKKEELERTSKLYGLAVAIFVYSTITILLLVCYLLVKGFLYLFM